MFNYNFICVRNIRLYILALLFSSIFSLQVHSQINSYDLKVTTGALGNNLLTNTSFPSVIYEIGVKNIVQANIDSVNNLLTIETINWGLKTPLLIQYDLTSHQELWRIKLSQSINHIPPQIDFIDNKIYERNETSITHYDSFTGEEVWRNLSSIMQYLPEQGICLGYSDISNDLIGIDILTGETLWKRRLVKRYAWGEFCYINDATYCINNSSLQLVNIKTGKGWDFIENNDSADDFFELVKSRSFVLERSPKIKVNTRTPVLSNIYSQDAKIYFCTKKRLYNFSITGDLLWSSQLLEDLTNSPRIYSINEKLYLLNYGVAYSRERTWDLSCAYMASYDFETGNQIYLNVLNSENRTGIRSVMTIGENLFFLRGGILESYKFSDGSLQSSFSPDRKKHGRLVSLAISDTLEFDNPYKITNNRTWNVSSFKASCTKKRGQLTINTDLKEIDYTQLEKAPRICVKHIELTNNIRATISISIPYNFTNNEEDFNVFAYAKAWSRSFAKKNPFTKAFSEDIVVYDANDRVVAKFDNVKCLFIGSNLYSIDKNQISIVNLDEIY